MIILSKAAEHNHDILPTKSDIINIVSFHFIIIPLENTFLLNASGPPDPPLGEYRATDIKPNDLEIALPTPISIDAFQIT